MIQGTITRGGEVLAEFIARAGTTVEWIEALSADGRTVVGDVALTPPEPTTGEEAQRWAEQFTQDAWHVHAWLLQQPSIAALETGSGEDEEEGLGFDSEEYLAHFADEIGRGHLYDSGCAEVKKNAHRARWRGCYNRYTVSEQDPWNWYSGDESVAHGKGTFWWAMTYGKTEHDYRKGYGMPIKWAPTSTINSGKCRTVTTKLEYEGTGFSTDWDVCPERVHPYSYSNLFKAVWEGHNNGETVVAAHAVDFVKVPNGKPSGFVYRVARGYTAW